MTNAGLQRVTADLANLQRPAVTVNNVTYQWPSRPVVVVCIDGGDPSYLEAGMRDGIVPNLQRFIRQGFSALAQGTVPSFTCPNNMSLITGAPPSVHGISGNFYLDVATGREVVMTGPELLRCDTILAAFAQHGARCVAITAKDKLRQQLGKGLDVSQGHVCFSAEKASACTMVDNGIQNVLPWLGQPQPAMYSMELSLLVLQAGLKLLQHDQPDLMFLSLTDYIQHKHAPGDPVANAFYSRVDALLGELERAGAVVAVTADHGMNDKSDAHGLPQVLYLQDVLDQALGAGTTRVICPITDSFVRHHGALGGFVRVWCLDPAVSAEQVIDIVREQPGVALALNRSAVCDAFDLPADREADVAVIAVHDWVIGGARREHDLTALGHERLRSHGSTTEATVPFIVSAPLNPAYQARAEQGLHSYQIFEFALNGCQAERQPQTLSAERMGSAAQVTL